MKKIFRMANAELNKIFMKPSMFVLSTILVIALVLSFFMFKPTTPNTKYTYELNSATAIYNEFIEDYKDLEYDLVSVKKSIDDFLATENDTLTIFQNKFQSTSNQFYNRLYVTVLEMGNTETPTPDDYEEVKKEFNLFATYIEDLKSFMLTNVKNKQVNFFITNNEYNEIYKEIKSISDNIPSFGDNNNDLVTTKAIIDYTNVLVSAYDLRDLNIKASKLEKIEIDNNELINLLGLYYTPNITETQVGSDIEYNHSGKLEELFNAIGSYYFENITNVGEGFSEKEFMATLNENIAKYYDYIQICKNLLKNNFELMRIGAKTDEQIVSYNGFSGTSIYNLKKSITTSKYFFDNNTFGYEYLTAFNFGVNSGDQTNAYDFAFFAMQILSALIVLFVIFFACGVISGEQSSGTLKMTAIRPYTRNKIYSGKFLACFNVSLILLTVSLVASMAVGIATFGFTMQNALIVINANSVLIINPILLMLIYFGTILVDIIFYIALAIFISMLVKPTTISTAITASIFMASTIISGITNASWIKFIPSTHLGLFKFFTTSNMGIFSFSVVPGVNLLISIIIVLSSIFVLNILGRVLLVNKSLDKWGVLFGIFSW